MAQQSTVVLALVAAASNGIALSQAVAAPGPLTLNGSLVASGVASLGAYQRRVAVDSSNVADAGLTFTVSGTNQSGAPIGETLTIAADGTTASVLDYLTITRIVANAAMAGNVTAGTTDIGSSPWIVDNIFIDNWSMRVAVAIISGTATYTVEWTMDDPNRIGPSYVPTVQGWSQAPYGATPPLVWSDPSLVGMTVNGTTGFADGPVFAHRLTITAGTGTVVMQTIQAGIRGD